MIATEHGSQTTLGTAVGVSSRSTAIDAIEEAADVARRGLDGATAHLALVITAGSSTTNAVAVVRDVLGPVGVAGGRTAGLLTDAGILAHGALVVALATEGDATSGTACVSGADLGDAGRCAARLILAGWPFRLRYPRGLGIAFTADGSPLDFLDSWRQLMGPKMRTVCGVMPGGALYGGAAARPIASVACLEAPYSTGLGHGQGFAPGTAAEPDVLIQSAADATTTALKRLDERSARLVLVLESAARREALGARAADEWTRVLAEVGDRAPCVGWVCERVSGYGRGIHPSDDHGALLVAAIGDAPGVTA